MLSEAEKQDVLVSWNKTRTDYPRHQTIHRLFEEQVERTPAAVAIQLGSETWTYGQLNARSNQIAHYIRNLAANRGAVVGICLERSLDLIASLIGILKAGATYLPLDPDYPVERLAYMLRDASAAVVITTSKELPKLAADAGVTRIVCLDLDRSGLESFPRDNCSSEAVPEDPAYLMYTSGSTGKPKGVVVGHRAVVRLVKNTNYCDFGPQQVFLQLAPVSFDASTFEIWGPLLNGAKLVVMPPGAVSLAGIGSAIRHSGVTTLWLTAGLFHLMVEQRIHDLQPLRQLVAGGDVLSPRHVQEALRQIPSLLLINGYGPTEGTTFTCCHQMTSANPPGDNVPIGVPISNTTVYLLDDNMEPVAVGVVGELFIGGDGLSFGYWNDSAGTSHKFVSNPFSKDPESRLYRTGDLARYRSDGVIEFCGRKDLQVKVAGHRIEPGEIEAALTHHPAVHQAVVVPIGDGSREKRLVAYVTANQSQNQLVAELHQFLSITLPSYMIPSAILVIDQMPLGPNGKVDRSRLPAPISSSFARETGVEAAQTGMEQRIADLWKRVLNVEELGMDDNFFDLGGDSLGLIEIHAELQKLTSRELSITDLFEHTTIRSLARHLTEPLEKQLSGADDRAAKRREELHRLKHRKAAQFR